MKLTKTTRIGDLEETRSIDFDSTGKAPAPWVFRWLIGDDADDRALATEGGPSEP
jgi:hypothetical protein